MEYNFFHNLKEIISNLVNSISDSKEKYELSNLLELTEILKIQYNVKEISHVGFEFKTDEKENAIFVYIRNYTRNRHESDIDKKISKLRNEAYRLLEKRYTNNLILNDEIKTTLSKFGINHLYVVDKSKDESTFILVIR